MEISLIIPVYNEEKLIEKTLISAMAAKLLYEKDLNNAVQIIVVNNNSQDRTVEICKKYDVSIVFEKINNIARARNTGARYASGEVVCFLDADSEVSSNIFLLIKKYMQTNNYIGGGTKFKLDRKNFIFSLIFVGSVLATHIIGLSGVLIYTKKIYFEELGGFDEKFYAAEDIDFVLRMRDFGNKKGKRYCNIYSGYVITSSRKFKVLKFKDLLMQGGLLLHKSLRENPDKCEQWYNTKKYR